MRKAYHFGVELWEALQEMPGFAERNGDAEHEGVRQGYKTANPESPNASRPIDVVTVVEERAVNAATGYETATAIENTLHAVETLLLARWLELGPLCYCENHERVAAVSGNETAGSNVTVGHGTPGAGWVPAAGEYVLFSKPTTGGGFTSIIESVGAGTVVCDLTANLTSDWVMRRVERVFTDVMYRRMSHAPARGPDDPQRDISEVTYVFTGYGQVLTPTATVLAHGAT